MYAHGGNYTAARNILSALSKEVPKAEEAKLYNAIMYSLGKLRSDRASLKINTGRLVLLVQQADVLSYE